MPLGASSEVARETTNDGSGPVDTTPLLENRTLWEQVADHLRGQILGDELDPGTELNEVALARSLGVSRGPVREALRRLQAEGLVTVTPRRRTIVTHLTRREFVGAYQVREALEALAIRLAVPRLQDDDRRRLRELHRRMQEQARRGAVDDFFHTNAEFHELFVRASGNPTLQEMYRRLLGQMGRYLTRSLALRGSLGKSIGEHEAILEAVEAGDAEQAAALLADHIEVPQRVTESEAGRKLFADEPEPGAEPAPAGGGGS